VRGPGRDGLLRGPASGRVADEAKRAIRQEVARRLAALPPAQRALEEELVTAAVQASREWQAARTVLLYRSVPPEFSTVGLANGAWRAGKRVLFPKVGAAGLTLHAAGGWTELRPGYRGIPEPTGPEVPAESVELSVVPGMAFDAANARLGRGGGFFDRLIPRLPGPVWAVAFGCQLVGEVPRASHDAHVHRVWTAETLPQL